MHDINILITGARAPIALELSRNFARYGHSVFVADSLSMALSRSSRSVKGFYQLPSPRFNQEAFIKELIRVIKQTKADILLPACEETFYIAKNKDAISKKCPEIKIDTDNIVSLCELHNKYAFISLGQSLGVPVPQTYQAHNQQDICSALQRLGRDAVVKPNFSRFGNRVSVITNPDDVKVIKEPHVVQEFVEGELYCVYVYAREGKIRVAVAYKSPSYASGSTLSSFQYVERPDLIRYAKKFIHHFKYSGHISFDFIVSDTRSTIIECNPRPTSGIHVLAKSDLAGVFYGECNVLEPLLNKQLLYINILRPKLSSIGYYYALLNYRDCIFRLSDIAPSIHSIKSFIAFKKIAKQHHVSLLDAMTYDIQFNGV